ncbi:hypothetical protein IV203_012679 [Nitzschia inconspicua]|uniref:Uncharacterized protein n=1 Tax=Nitzschia inconspicua TaxID=303405 RepID=A0A9K3PJJ2_9STRA|nr:hypothetical protein IV203_014266 [Nitzschia inconspicua]KAG7350082.1 hypothetical protein IV203_012679 [Nitzschia inconspicua]
MAPSTVQVLKDIPSSFLEFRAVLVDVFYESAGMAKMILPWLATCAVHLRYLAPEFIGAIVDSIRSDPSSELTVYGHGYRCRKLRWSAHGYHHCPGVMISEIGILSFSSILR